MESIPLETVRAQIERVLASQVLRNRAALQRLLRFLGDHLLNGSAADLKEYTVGVDLFGKPESYDPQADPSARIQLGKLRQKLDEYYRTEGGADAIVIEIPQRRFALQATRRAVDAVPPQAPVSMHVALRSKSWMSLTMVALIGACGWLLYLNALRDPPMAQADGEVVTRFWRAVGSGANPSIVCLATPLFLGLAGNRYRSPRLETFEQAQEDPEVRDLMNVVGGDTLSREYDFTGVGEATAAFLLGGLFARMRAPVDLRLEPALSWEDIKASNVVFLGSTKFNQKLREIPLPTNFVVERGGIRNRAPLAGEPGIYTATRTPAGQVLEDYALISRIPGLSPGLTYYLLGSRSSNGSWSAAECATKAECLAPLLEKVSSGGPEPEFFEIVVRVRYRDRVPIEVSHATHRVPGGHPAAP